MNIGEVPEELSRVLRTYCNIEVDDVPALSAFVTRARRNPTPENRWVELFRDQLAAAIINKSISPKQYEKLTDDEYETYEEVQNKLREIWHEVFSNEPIPL